MSRWPLVRLDSCSEIVSGATPDTSEASYWNGDVYWATPKDLSELRGSYISATPRRITRAGLASCSAEVLPPESVLFSSRAPIGHVAINTVPMATNQGFKSFVPRRDRLDARFLYHWLRKNRPYLESLGNGVTFKEVSKAVVSRIEIPLPSLTEQRRIAEILDKADALRTKRRAALAQLDALNQSIFLDMFGDPVANPKRLNVKPLIELVDSSRPISYGILKPGPDVSSGVKYVRVVDMKFGGIDLSKIRRTAPEISDSYKRSLLRPGDVLLSIRGHVGRLATVPVELEGANITQDTARLAIEGALPIFVRECLRTPGLQRWMAKHTKGVAVRGINLGDVKRMPVIVPALERQHDFVQAAMAIDRMRSSEAEAALQADALFDSLQHRAFRGEL